MKTRLKLVFLQCNTIFAFCLLNGMIHFVYASELDCDDNENQLCYVNQTECVCNCRPGFILITDEDGDLASCAKVKSFGGMITIDSVFSSNQDERLVVKDALKEMFDDAKYYIDANVLELPQDSSVATYQLLFKNSAIVNATYVQNVFTTNYSCSNLSMLAIKTSTGNVTVNLVQSCSTLVSNDSTILCDNFFPNYCDQNSTVCVSGSNGYVKCECKSDFLPINTTSCSVDLHQCVFDADCNGPFGSCVRTVSGVRVCSCAWGVSGVNCQTAWLLIFTIVTTVLGFVILCLIAVIVYLKRNGETATEVSSPSYDPPLSGPKYSFSNIPPGVMRARLADPSTNEADLETDDKAAASHSNMPISARADRLKQQKYSYLNLAFDGKEQQQASSMPTSKGTNVGLQPTNYF